VIYLFALRLRCPGSNHKQLARYLDYGNF